MSRTILLADDSITIQKVVELTFLEGDYEVASFNNGDDALGQLESLAPALVIADIHMPGATGYEVSRRVKEGSSSTPVLLLVGTFEPFDEADVAASGADGFLMKPFDAQELMSRVEEILGTGSSDAAEEAVDEAAESSEPVAVDAQPAPEEPAAERAEEREVPSAAAVEAPAPEPPGAAVPTTTAPAGLSDEEIDRIARRVVEAITPEVVREVAREVVPQVAEIVVKERIRQLEQEVE